VYFLNWNLTLSICRFCGCLHYFSCNLWGTLHFSIWTCVLPFVLPTLLFSYFPLYDIINSNTIYGLVYFPKFNTCTSKTQTSHFSACTSFILQTIPLFFLAIYGRLVIRLKRIYNFWCSMLVFTPFAYCFVTLSGTFMHFPELTY
jgi:hypothetical protein